MPLIFGPGKQKWLAVVLIALFCSAGIFLALRLHDAWAAPLGPVLALPTRTAAPPVTELVAFSTSPPLAAATTTINPQATRSPATSTPGPSLTPTPPATPLCDGPAVQYLLGVGIDSGSGGYLYGLGDVIRVTRIDFVTPKVVVLSIPHDLWVEIPDISDHYDITHGKLNQAFLFGGPGMGYYDGPGGGAGLLARTLALNYGIYVDHYGVVDMLAFTEIVDAVGGIDVFLPENVDGHPAVEGDEDFGFFYAGQHHFSGAEALRFARIRERYNDFVRVENQNLVISALRQKLLTPKVLPKVPQLVDAAMDKVLTDPSPQQISQLMCLLPKLNSENVVLTSLPQEIFTSERIYSPIQKDWVSILSVDNTVIRNYVERFNAGIWP